MIEQEEVTIKFFSQLLKQLHFYTEYFFRLILRENQYNSSKLTPFLLERKSSEGGKLAGIGLIL